MMIGHERDPTPGWPELNSVEGPAPGHDDAGKGLDVGRTGVEVDDAGAQRVAPADHRVRNEKLAALLQPREQLAIQIVQ